MEDQELIFKIQQLKQIKPRKDWAVLSKSQIFGNNISDVKVNKAIHTGFSLNPFKAYFGRRHVYSLAAFLFISAGLVGFMKYGSFQDVKVSQKSIASLPSTESALKNSNVEELKLKSQNLINVTKNKPQDFALAIKEIKTATNNLTEAIKNDPKLAGEVAMEVKNNGTLLSVVSETELEQASDALYKTIDEQMIKDLETTTLTEDQKIIFSEAKDLFEQAKYSVVLEKILLINSRQ